MKANVECALPSCSSPWAWEHDEAPRTSRPVRLCEVHSRQWMRRPVDTVGEHRRDEGEDALAEERAEREQERRDRAW